MTSLIDNNIDELIKRVRQRTAVSDMVFVTAYPPRELPNPFDKYTVTVENTGIRQSQVFIGDTIGRGLTGRLYDISVTMRVYAPRDTSAAALLRMSAQLFDAVECCDRDDMVTKMEMGEVRYDTASRTIYRDLRLVLSCILSGRARHE